MLRPPSSGDAARLREFLAESGYTYRKFLETPALRESPNKWGDMPVLLERTRVPSPLSVLLRWYFIGAPQESEAVAGMVPDEVVAVMLDHGMLVREGNRLTATVMLTPSHDYVFASDPIARMRSQQSADAVALTGQTTALLQLFTIRAPTLATLDLGAGCGIQGILAAAHSRHVLATDLNPRAEEFTRFNARLNGVENIECLTGDTYEPVRGRTFDLILANLPFFVTPSHGPLYCENSMDLDQYCRRVVREAAGHLNEGGYFQAVLEWVQLRGQTWQERISEWLDGTGCDAWILRSYARDAIGYAAERIRQYVPEEMAAARFTEWMAYYSDRSVESVHGGVLTMRRRPGPNWVRIDEMPVDPGEPAGDAVLDLFANQDALAACPRDEDLLPMRPRLSPHAQLEQKLRVSEGKWATASAMLQLTGGVPASLAVERGVPEFLARCDGTRTVGELAGELAGRVKASPEVVRQQCCAVVRKLAERRFLQVSR